MLSLEAGKEFSRLDVNSNAPNSHIVASGPKCVIEACPIAPGIRSLAPIAGPVCVAFERQGVLVRGQCLRRDEHRSVGSWPCMQRIIVGRARCAEFAKREIFRCEDVYLKREIDTVDVARLRVGGAMGFSPVRNWTGANGWSGIPESVKAE